ncbi:hypothetical protein [Methylocystis sp. ATCC 49242]|uniref:hypothetical protein n=1 Tax=Methylocystis sp. ATCC 49242 TaxID=622637 RepID=UPI0001F8762C|nr:hypothetical protein [Methylocystis sp. ATCC 49242]
MATPKAVPPPGASLAARRPLLTPAGAFDRAAIMSDAHRQLRLMASHGWSWSRCLAFSWARAKAQRGGVPSLVMDGGESFVEKAVQKLRAVRQTMCSDATRRPSSGNPIPIA